MEISLFLKKQRKMVQHISEFRVFHIKTDLNFQTYISLLIPEFIKKYALVCLLFLAQSTTACHNLRISLSVKNASTV